MHRLVVTTFLIAITALSAGAQTDINVLYIQKTPLIDYNGPNGGWPAAGSVVTWNAKVKNWGSNTIQAVVCEWWLDGVKVQTDTITNLTAGETRNVTYHWLWQQSTHILEFRADTTNLVTEVTEQNNVYSIHTNALTIGSWVEQGLYDWFHAHQIELGDGANSFEDWCYRMVKKWNEMNELAVWPVSPNGIVDRVRIEKVVVVPNGALPLNGGLATNNPDRFDRTVDLMWGHPYNPADTQTGGFWEVKVNGPFFIDYGEIHELNHARYIVDHYGFDTHQGDSSNPNILVTDKNGNYIAPYNQMYYGNKCADIMGAGGNAYSEYAAGAWNRKAGIRGPLGNQNSPGDIGVYMQDLPENNWFRFVDNTGAPLVGAAVSIYRATSWSGWYGKYFDNIADMVLTANSDGYVNLGRCPFSSSGTVTNTYGLSNAVFIIKVQHDGREFFTMGEVSDFGIEYWKGNKDNAYYTILVPWGATNTSTPVLPSQWKQDIFNSQNLTNLVDVKAFDPNILGGFVLRMPYPISSGVGKDNFSCRFTRSVFLNKGTYTFIMATDDGGRFYIDGVKHLERWSGGGIEPKKAVVTIDSTALRELKMDYYEASGAAVASLAIIPPKNTVPGPDDWKMEIYNSTNLTNLAEVSACPKSGGEGFSIDWGERAPGPCSPADGFSVRFTRKMSFKNGTYRFTTTSDDGVRLYIDGVRKINNWTAHPPTEDTIDVIMANGLHTIVVECYDTSGPAQIALRIVPILPDFDVRFISRTPRYDRYNVSYQTSIDPNEPETGKAYLTAEEQAKQRWPKPGELVTYTAHIRNTGHISGSCTYKWYYDGVQTASGTLPLLAPGGECTVSYSRPWDSEQEDHLIKFTVDPDDLTGEVFENNNTREDRTNALSFRLHVWQSLYDWFSANASTYTEIASFDDWAQQNIAAMNALLAQAVYPGTPQGIPERVRLDEIVIEPDTAPDPDPIGTHAPPDWPWDGRKGFTNAYLDDLGGGKNYFETNVSYLAGYDLNLIRALSYELGLINFDSLNITSGNNFAQAGIGHASTQYMAGIAGGGPFYSEHEAYALASNLHLRRGFTGDYLYDLPKTIKYRVIDSYRRPVANAVVSIYQEYPGKTIPNVLRWTLVSDSNGYITLPNRSCFGETTTATGHTLRDNPFGIVNTKGENGVFFVKVTVGSVTDYQFIEILPLNIAYWRGFDEEYTGELQVNINPEGKPTTYELYGVSMASSTLGYAVGTYGNILKWDGTRWSNMTSPTSQTLFGVDFSPGGAVAIACGNSGTVLVLDHGVWQKKTFPVTVTMYACVALSNTTFIVGGYNGELYRSVDSGNTWTKLNASPSTQGAIRSIKFFDSNNGLIVPATPPCYCTTDGGLTWAPAPGITGETNLLRDGILFTQDDGIVVSGSGKIYYSSDGGITWSTLFNFGLNDPIFGIDVSEEGSGWSVGRYHSSYATTILRRFDSGRWFNQQVCTSGTENVVNDVSLASSYEAWVVGRGGLLLRLMDSPVEYSATCTALEDVKMLPDGTNVTFNNADGDTFVSAVFQDCVYLEKRDRSAGIKIYTASGAVMYAPAGFTGIIDTENGEKVVRYGTVTCSAGSNKIEPLAMTAKSLGGKPNWIGTENLGLLVKVAGKVTNFGHNWLTIDDGSMLTASDKYPGIKILFNSISKPDPVPDFITVTGVATTEKVDGVVYRVVRPRTDQDIREEN